MRTYNRILRGVVVFGVLTAFVFADRLAADEKQADDVKVKQAVSDLFGQNLRDAKDQKVETKALAGKKVGIYFSAHWCPPCRAFTPKLVEVYNEIKAKDKLFEIVFVSSDRSKEDMLKYMEEYKMPWLAISHGAKEKDDLGKKFKVRGIPTLVVIDENGKTITIDARGDVMKHGADVFNKWK